MTNVTRILDKIEGGDPSAAAELLPLVYNELRQLAARRLANEKPGQTLQPTALVHEAYLKLLGNNQPWKSRGHFFGAAAEAMRRILVDNARRKQRPKHAGDLRRVALDDDIAPSEQEADQILALHEALDKLAAEDLQKAELVKLRYFAGLSVQQAADALGISRASAHRYWDYAKVFLYCAIEDEQK